jgi:hypothetical protein
MKVNANRNEATATVATSIDPLKTPAAKTTTAYPRTMAVFFMRSNVANQPRIWSAAENLSAAFACYTAFGLDD